MHSIDCPLQAVSFVALAYLVATLYWTVFQASTACSYDSEAFHAPLRSHSLLQFSFQLAPAVTGL